MRLKPMMMLTVLLLGVAVAREARAFYNPSTGRWLSRDPIGENGGANLYGFVNNVPTSKYDRFGLATVGDSVSSCHCCVCVGSVRFTNLTPTHEGNQYGHSFSVEVVLNYVKAKTIFTGSPTLQWRERSNRPPYEQGKPDEWIDVYAEVPGADVVDQWIQGRSGAPCPGSISVLLSDNPQASITLPKRTLDFEITVTSGANCPCPNAQKSRTIRARQEIEGPETSPGIIKTQTFTLGP